ncbi:hypothetical protein KGF56_003971 [Candida oxycetoniae]|uniref:Uncharacterized protein n=1 Tax=Candida oxycetoniae TaxID=497107 RepID=A0AAI9WWH8_9ASCO|nr:uncharacterized protein KGF56_003971 [Candida oxycetoniae]KAI3403236.2 hypothetical protein KGF56_003971 [Candida oxycetoniae]
MLTVLITTTAATTTAEGTNHQQNTTLNFHQQNTTSNFYQQSHNQIKREKQNLQQQKELHNLQHQKVIRKSKTIESSKGSIDYKSVKKNPSQESLSIEPELIKAQGTKNYITKAKEKNGWQVNAGVFFEKAIKKGLDDCSDSDSDDDDGKKKKFLIFAYDNATLNSDNVMVLANSIGGNGNFTIASLLEKNGMERTLDDDDDDDDDDDKNDGGSGTKLRSHAARNEFGKAVFNALFITILLTFCIATV